MRLSIRRLAATLVTFFVVSACPAIAAEPIAVQAPDDAPVVAVANKPETLADALVAAYGDNPQIIAQRATTRSADEAYVQARSVYGPTVSAVAGYRYQKDSIENAIGSPFHQSGFTSNYGIELSQSLYTSGRNHAGVIRGTAIVDEARQTLRLAEISLLTNAIAAYVGVRRDRELLSIANDDLGQLSARFGDSQKLYDHRESTRTDLDQTATRLAIARAQFAVAKDQLGVSLSNFLEVIGHVPGPLAPEPSIPGLPAILSQAYTIAQAENPAILAASAREQQARAAYEVARSAFGPTIDLTASAGRAPYYPYSEDLGVKTITGGVVLRMPLTSGGLRSSRLREAREVDLAERARLDDARRAVNRTTTQQWLQWTAARNEVVAYTDAVARATTAYEGAVKQQRAGDRTTLDVLILERDLLDVRSALVRARADSYLGQAGILAAMGRLDLATLVPNAPRYDPHVNFARVHDRAGLPLLTPLLHAIDGATVHSIARPPVKIPDGMAPDPDAEQYLAIFP